MCFQSRIRRENNERKQAVPRLINTEVIVAAFKRAPEADITAVWAESNRGQK